MIGYRDRYGRVLFVSDGISPGTAWGTFYRKPSGGMARFRGLPVRNDQIQAEQDLCDYAREHGLEPVEVDEHGA